MHTRPGVEPFTTRTPRVVAARRLARRRERTETGRFLAEGPQAVREAVAEGAVVELFVTADAESRYADLVATAAQAGARISPVTADALAALAETVHPQGLVAVCAAVDPGMGLLAAAAAFCLAATSGFMKVDVST